LRIRNLFGLPAHPLLVHIPIVLIPLCGVGALAMVVSPSVRRRIGWVVTALTVIAGVGTQLTISSGQALRFSVPKSRPLTRHVTIAESLRPFVLLLFFGIVAMMALDLARARRVGSPDRLPDPGSQHPTTTAASPQERTLDPHRSGNTHHRRRNHRQCGGSAESPQT